MIVQIMSSQRYESSHQKNYIMNAWVVDKENGQLFEVSTTIFPLLCFEQGFGVTWCRTMGLMCTYFVLLDSGRRHFPDLFRKPILGPFLSSGLAATYPFKLTGQIVLIICLQVLSKHVANLRGRDLSLVGSLRGVNHGFWSHIRCSGQNTAIFSHQGILQSTLREIAINTLIYGFQVLLLSLMYQSGLQ